MLYCLIAFILGYLVSRHMGNGFSVGGQKKRCTIDLAKTLESSRGTAFEDDALEFANHTLRKICEEYKTEAKCKSDDSCRWY